MQPRSTASYCVAIVGNVIACALMGLCARADGTHSSVPAKPHAIVDLMSERDIERNFELYDLSLQAVINGLQRSDVMEAPPAVWRDVLFDLAMIAKFLGAMLVLGAAGNIILDWANDVPRQGNFSDRRYFSVHRDDPNVRLYVGAPYTSDCAAAPLASRLLADTRGRMDRLPGSS